MSRGIRSAGSFAVLTIVGLAGGALAGEPARVAVEDAVATARDEGRLAAAILVDAKDEARALAAIEKLEAATRDRFVWVVRPITEQGRVTAEAQRLGAKRGTTLLVLDPWADDDGRVLARLTSLRTLSRDLQSALADWARRGHPRPRPVRWEVTADTVVVPAGKTSAFDLADDALVALAEREFTRRELAPDDAARAMWTKELAKARRDNRAGMTLTWWTARYEWNPVDGRTEVTFRGSGLAVQLVPVEATPVLRSHEAGHAALFAAGLLAGHRLADLAFDALVVGPPDGPKLLTAGDAVIAATSRYGRTLDAAFDRATDHRGPTAVAGQLAAAAQKGLERRARRTGAALGDVVDAATRAHDDVRTEADFARLAE